MITLSAFLFFFSFKVLKKTTHTASLIFHHHFVETSAWSRDRHPPLYLLGIRRWIVDYKAIKNLLMKEILKIRTRIDHIRKGKRITEGYELIHKRS